MPSFPNLRSGTVSKTGIGRARRFNTSITQFTSGREQRYAQAIDRAAFTLEFGSVDGHDLSTVRAFFYEMKGRFGRFDLTIDGTTTFDCCFDTDAFPRAESTQGRFSFSLPVVQVR